MGKCTWEILPCHFHSVFVNRLVVNFLLYYSHILLSFYYDGRGVFTGHKREGQGKRGKERSFSPFWTQTQVRVGVGIESLKPL